MLKKSVGEHPNVVNLIGACTTNGDLNVILEYCSNGSLLKYLRFKKDDFCGKWIGEEDNDVSYSQLLNMALGAAQGLEFLESNRVCFFLILE